MNNLLCSNIILTPNSVCLLNLVKTFFLVLKGIETPVKKRENKIRLSFTETSAPDSSLFPATIKPGRQRFHMESGFCLVKHKTRLESNPQGLDLPSPV